MTDPIIVAAHAWVEESCAAQGLPLRVADPAVLAAVAGLLGVAPGGSRVAASSPASSDPPDGGETARVELVVAAPSGADNDVVEDGGDDRVLPGQR
jgi:hypothetical protein